MDSYLMMWVLGSFAVGAVPAYVLGKRSSRQIEQTMQAREARLDAMLVEEKKQGAEVAARQATHLEEVGQAHRLELKEIQDSLSEVKMLVAVRDAELVGMTMRLEEAARTHERELAAAKEQGLSVVTYPYEEVTGDDGWVVDDRRAEIGYKFQLFVNGVPCFEAHKVPIKVLVEKEVSSVKIESVGKQVIELLDTIASKHPAISVARKALK